MRLTFLFLLFSASTAYSLADVGEHGTLVRPAVLRVAPGPNSEKLLEVERGRALMVLERTKIGSESWCKAFVSIATGENQRDVTGWLVDKGIVTPSTRNGDQIIFGE